MFKRLIKLFNKLNIFSFLLRAWNGEASLGRAFWIVYILFGAIQLLILEYIFMQQTGAYILLDVHNAMTDKLITYAFPYLFFSTMCVWACGKKSWIEWKISSRLFVSLPLMAASFHLTNIF